MPRLLALLATRTASLVAFADISRSLSIPQTTLKRYMALLEATFLLQLLPAWSSHARGACGGDVVVAGGRPSLGAAVCFRPTDS